MKIRKSDGFFSLDVNVLWLAGLENLVDNLDHEIQAVATAIDIQMMYGNEAIVVLDEHSLGIGLQDLFRHESIGKEIVKGQTTVVAANFHHFWILGQLQVGNGFGLGAVQRRLAVLVAFQDLFGTLLQ